MGIPSQIFDHLCGSSKGFFRIHYPLFLSQCFCEGMPFRFLCIGEHDLTLSFEHVELVEKVRPVHLSHCLDGEQDLVPGLFSLHPFSRPPSGRGDHTMHMRMKAELLSPCMERRDDAGHGIHVPWICCKNVDRTGGCLKSRSNITFRLCITMLLSS